MTMVLGVNDLKRLEEGLERGCGGSCWRTKPKSWYPLCEGDWLCEKIKPTYCRGELDAPCPCDCGADTIFIIKRVVTMLRTGRTID
jgi:hypothetical protein